MLTFNMQCYTVSPLYCIKYPKHVRIYFSYKIASRSKNRENFYSDDQYIRNVDNSDYENKKTFFYITEYEENILHLMATTLHHVCWHHFGSHFIECVALILNMYLMNHVLHVKVLTESLGHCDKVSQNIRSVETLGLWVTLPNFPCRFLWIVCHLSTKDFKSYWPGPKVACFCNNKQP